MFRKSFRVLLPGLAAVLLLPAANARPANNSTEVNTCSNQTIKGNYAFRISGFILAPPPAPMTPPVPPPPPVIVNYRDGVALTYFDGKTDSEGRGGLWQKDFIMGNGSFSPNNPDDLDGASGFNNGETGSYKVFPDCTGVAEIDFPAPPGASSGTVILLKLVIAKSGKEIHTIVSSLTPPGASTSVYVNIHSDAERLEPLIDHR
ncbi:MAG TPA: hypothetical protein VLV88_10975 [Terriglobales bacterium]|nr:hypothetical protein [Terriglobales bacterium]